MWNIALGVLLCGSLAAGHGGHAHSGGKKVETSAIQAVVDAGRGVIRGRGRRSRVQLGPHAPRRGGFRRLRAQAVLEGGRRRGRTAPREGDVDAVAS